MLSDYNGIKLKISNKKIVRKYPNIWKLNNTQYQYESKRKSQEINTLSKNENKTKVFVECSKHTIVFFLPEKIFIALELYIKIIEGVKINHSSFCHRKLRKKGK